MIASCRITRTSVTSHQLAAAADLDREDADPWTMGRDSLDAGCRGCNGGGGWHGYWAGNWS